MKKLQIYIQIGGDWSDSTYDSVLHLLINIVFLWEKKLNPISGLTQ